MVERYSAALNLLPGTYTDGDWCEYTASGTLLNCNVTPVAAQVAANLARQPTALMETCLGRTSTQALTPILRTTGAVMERGRLLRAAVFVII